MRRKWLTCARCVLLEKALISMCTFCRFADAFAFVDLSILSERPRGFREI